MGGRSAGRGHDVMACLLVAHKRGYVLGVLRLSPSVTGAPSSNGRTRGCARCCVQPCAVVRSGERS